MISPETRDLVARLADLLRSERSTLVEFVLALADFDRARKWQELGYASLFDFLHRELALSKATAFFRKTAAVLVQQYPEIVEPLRDGRLCISSVAELAKVITPENRAEVLPRFFHRSKQEAKAVTAELRPAEVVPVRATVTAVRPTQAPSLGLRLDARTDQPNEPALAVVRPVELARPERGAPAVTAASPADDSAPRDQAVPLTADLNRLHVTVSSEFLAKLEAACSALSHTHPRASIEEILEAGLDLVLARDARKKALVAKPRPAPPPRQPAQGFRYVPAHVRRAVWKRDQGRCQWKLESGGVCGSTLRPQLDHIHPHALGGAATVDDLRVLCAHHNDLAARQVFGDAHMDLFTRRRTVQQRGDALAPPAVRLVDCPSS